MSKKNNSKNSNVLWTLVKAGCIMIGCTAGSALLINLAAAYQILVSLVVGAVATVAIMK